MHDGSVWTAIIDFLSLLFGGPTGLQQVLPGFLGSVFALLWIKGPWPRRMSMVGLGAVMSTYGGAWMAALTGLNEGFAGFLMGLFGVAVVDSIFKSWAELGLTEIIREFIRARLGLPHREE